MTLFGNMIFVDVTSQVKVRSYWIVVSPNPKSGVFMRRPCKDVEGRRPWDDRGRDWNDVFINQEMPRIAGNHQKLGEVRKGPPLEPPEMGPCRHLGLRLPASRAGRE